MNEYPKSYKIEVGEISVTLEAYECCGVWSWYGRFPDRSVCCDYGHPDNKEAEDCARQRVRIGFVIRKVHADE